MGQLKKQAKKDNYIEYCGLLKALEENVQNHDKNYHVSSILHNKKKKKQGEKQQVQKKIHIDYTKTNKPRYVSSKNQKKNNSKDQESSDSSLDIEI